MKFHETFHDNPDVRLIALSSESPAVVRHYVEAHEVSYPVVCDPGGRFFRTYQIRAIPHAVLLDTEGATAWEGHPGKMNSIIEVTRNLLANLDRIVLDRSIPRELAEAAALAKSGAWGKALDRAEAAADSPDANVAEGARYLSERILRPLRRCEKQVERLLGEKHFTEALERLEELEHHLHGSTRAKAVSKRLRRLRRDPAVRKDLSAAKEWAKYEHYKKRNRATARTPRPS